MTRVPLVTGLTAVISLVALCDSAAEPWALVRSPNFTLVGDPPERTLRDVGFRLEQLREAFSRLFPRSNVRAPVRTVVLVLASDRSFESFTSVDAGQLVHVGGTFVPGVDVNYVALRLNAGDSAYRTVAHEYAHAMLRSALPWVPLWFSEGFAEFASTIEVAKSGAVTIGRPVPQHVYLLRRSALLPLGQLFAVNRGSPEYRQASFYAQSWALVHYFMTGSTGGQARLARFIDLLSTGLPTGEAFTAVFGVVPEVLESQLRRYVGGVSFSYTRYRFAEAFDMQRIPAGQHLSAAAAAGYLGDWLWRFGDEAAGRRQLEAVVASAPHLAQPHAALGMLHLQAGRYDEAAQAVDRAIALDDDQALYHYYRALVIVRRAAEARQAAPSDDELMQAQASLERAISLEPDLADALHVLGYVRLAQGTALDEAQTSVERALSLMPARLHYRLTLARVVAAQGHFAEVQRLLGPLVMVPDAPLAHRARSLLGQLGAIERAKRAAVGTGESNASFEVASRPDRRPFTEMALRPPRDGEQRAVGLLEALECTGQTLFMTVRSGDRVLRLRARDRTNVQIISYRPGSARLTVRCGSAEPTRVEVCVTWRPPAEHPEGDGHLDGEVVAVEVLPNRYAPPIR